MSSLGTARRALAAAAPVMAGYIAIGIPCGIMEQQVGLDALQAFILSVVFYSGAGQFMISSMWLSGAPLLSIITSVSFVNMRQVLYAASFSQFCSEERRGMTYLFASTVTDESFGVNLVKFMEGDWDVRAAACVNCLCMLTWAIANAAGVFIGSAVSIPTVIASFAMTSIFICLLFTQRFEGVAVPVACASVAGVVVCKAIGLAGPAILIGALAGVFVGSCVRIARRS